MFDLDMLAYVLPRDIAQFRGPGKPQVRRLRSAVELVKGVVGGSYARGKWQVQTLGQFAYIMAIAGWETNHAYAPVEEAYYIKSYDIDAWRRKHLAKYYPYYGRGFVQLTWLYNYQWAGEMLGIDLVNYPDKALEWYNAVNILVIGMLSGQFGKPLGMYVSKDKVDYLGARRSVNEQDRAAEIKVLAEQWERALGEASFAMRLVDSKGDK